MYGVKFLLYGFSFQPWMIILTAALQLVTLPIIMLTSKVLVKEITPQKLFSSAQMFAMAVFIGGCMPPARHSAAMCRRRCRRC